MITPENPKAQAELEERIKQNLEAGDWGPSPPISSAGFIPVEEEAKTDDIVQEAGSNNLPTKRRE